MSLRPCEGLLFFPCPWQVRLGLRMMMRLDEEAPTLLLTAISLPLERLLLRHPLEHIPDYP